MDRKAEQSSKRKTVDEPVITVTEQHGTDKKTQKAQ